MADDLDPAAVEPLDQRRIQFARELADPDCSLSVPEPAKAVLRDLLAEVERLRAALTTARRDALLEAAYYLDRLMRPETRASDLIRSRAAQEEGR